MAKKRKKSVSKRSYHDKRSSRVALKNRKGKAVKGREKVKGKSKAISGKSRKSSSRIIYKDFKGRFTTKAKWESENLPKKKRVKKSRRPAYVEKERFTTEGMRYEYREFELRDYAPETIERLIDDVLTETKPHPSVFHVVVEYTTEDDILGTFSTRFMPFRRGLGRRASDEVYALAGQYEVATIDRITLYATYSLKDTYNVERKRPS